MYRDEIWWANLSDPTGSEPGYRRPVLLIQGDTFNQSNINTVIIATITSNLRLADAPGNIFLSRQDSGLPRDSVVNVAQILTIDKSLLTERVGSLFSNLQEDVDEGLRLVLFCRLRGNCLPDRLTPTLLRKRGCAQVVGLLSGTTSIGGAAGVKASARSTKGSKGPVCSCPLTAKSLWHKTICSVVRPSKSRKILSRRAS